MDYHNYAADASPHLSSSPSSASSSAAADTTQTIRPSYQPLALTMNNSRRLSLTEQSDSLLPQETLTTFHAYHGQSSSSSSPFPSSSTDNQRISLLTTPSTTLIDTFDQDSSNNTTLESESLSGTLQLASSGPSSSTTVITDYWHGQAPPPPQSLLLRTHTLHCGDVNHSERGIAGFVSKLYQSLQAPDDGQTYARWCKHNGKDMFIIECIPKFTEVVLPRLFKHCKFASFVRQLNIYGFQRDTDARKTKDTKDKESCRWHHPYFRPGRRDLFHLIRRKATRYSRRKRVKMEQDPATIVNVGSGDESDSEMINEDDGGRSSSVSSTAVSTHPQDNFNKNTPFNQATTTTNNQFQLVYGCLQDQAHTHPSQPVHMQETGQSAAAATVLSTAPPDDYMPNVDPSQQVQSDNNNYGAPNMVQENNESRLVLASPSTPAGGGWNMSQQQQHEALDPRTASMREQELWAQIVRLRQAYQQMTRDLTAQISGAYGMIEAQSRRIQSLEAALAKSNMGMTHGHEYMTPYVEPTTIMQMNHHQQPRAQQPPPSSASATLPHPSNLYTHLYNDNSTPLPGSHECSQQISGMKPTSVKAENLAILTTAPASEDWVSVYSTSNPPNTSNAPSASSPAVVVEVQTGHGAADQSSSTFNSDASKYTRGMI